MNAKEACQFMEACVPDEKGAAMTCLLECDSINQDAALNLDSPNTDSSGSPCKKVTRDAPLADSEGDIGYLSNSTSSSSHGLDCPSMDHSSQVDTGAGPSALAIDWSDIECEDGCQHGGSEMDDLLYHFDLFFRERFSTELQQFQDSMHNMLSEQQIHVRQIIQTAIKSHRQQKDTGDFLDHIDSPVATDCSFEQVRDEQNLKMENEESSSLKDRLLLQLLSAACRISVLLQRQEYKT